ncbi:hypothetical protein Hanom_Chr05g00394051 [Helianthus anomalus]
MQWRNLRFPTEESKTYIPKISIKPGVKNVYNQKFLYENYILSTTERKVRGVGRPLLPPQSYALGSMVILGHL